jgi:hypothetical protein
MGVLAKDIEKSGMDTKGLAARRLHIQGVILQRGANIDGQGGD